MIPFTSTLRSCLGGAEYSWVDHAYLAVVLAAVDLVLACPRWITAMYSNIKRVI